MTTWILVADESRARLFRAQARDGELDEIAEITHPEGRMHDHDLTTDSLPRVHESVGNTRHSVDPHTSIREKVSAEFAHELVELLEQGRVHNAFDQLALVAAPRFLGVLRSSIGDELSKLLVESIDKNVTRSTVEEIRSLLDAKRTVG